MGMLLAFYKANYTPKAEISFPHFGNLIWNDPPGKEILVADCGRVAGRDEGGPRAPERYLVYTGQYLPVWAPHCE